LNQLNSKENIQRQLQNSTAYVFFASSFRYLLFRVEEIEVIYYWDGGWTNL